MKDKRVDIRVSSEVKAILIRLARSSNMTVSSYIEHLILREDAGSWEGPKFKDVKLNKEVLDVAKREYL